MNDVVLRDVSDRLLQRIEIAIEVLIVYENVAALAGRLPFIASISDDLPAPDGPSNPINSFGWIESETPSISVTLSAARAVLHLSYDVHSIDPRFCSRVENADISRVINCQKKCADEASRPARFAYIVAVAVQVNAVGRAEVFDKNAGICLQKPRVAVGNLQTVEFFIARICASDDQFLFVCRTPSKAEVEVSKSVG